MLNTVFKRMCENMIEISKHTGEQRERELNLFMSQGYLFLDLTDKQVNKLKVVLKNNYPNEYKEYDKPDEHGFTSEFYYLRFK